eukprot:scaffold266338_cov31-Prasinocladus_malaysianus.AAC.2
MEFPFALILNPNDFFRRSMRNVSKKDKQTGKRGTDKQAIDMPSGSTRTYLAYAKQILILHTY